MLLDSRYHDSIRGLVLGFWSGNSSVGNIIGTYSSAFCEPMSNPFFIIFTFNRLITYPGERVIGDRGVNQIGALSRLQSF